MTIISRTPPRSPAELTDTSSGTSSSIAARIASATSVPRPRPAPRREPRAAVRRGSGARAPPASARPASRGGHPQHRQLDQVGRRALHDRVDGRPLREREGEHAGGVPPGRPRPDAADRPPPAEDRGHMPIAAAAVEHLVHEGGRPGEGLEVGGDEGGRLRLRDPQALGQAEAALAVEDAEVHRLGHPPHARR